MRQRGTVWWETSETPHIDFLEVTSTPVAGGVRYTLPDGEGRAHIAVSVVAVRNPTFWSAAPEQFLFYDGDETTPGDQATPIYAQSRVYLGTFPTDIGTESFYGYLYIVPCAAENLYMYPADSVGASFTGVSVLGLKGLVEIGPTGGNAESVPAPTQTISGASGGYTGLNGVWLLAALPTAERAGTPADVSWPSPPIGNASGSATGGEPGFLVGETGPVSGGDLEFGFPDSDGAILGTWWQLLPVSVPETVTPTPTTVVTNLFDATTTRPVGVTVEAPAAVVLHEFDADVTMPPAGTGWWAVLVDADGATVARMPRAVIGSIVETLNDIDTAEVTIQIRSRAGDLIDVAEVLPELEVQIWRGNVLWLWGPIIDAQPDGDHWQLSVRDCRWHLTRRHVGELGGTFGDKPPYFHDSPANLRFEEGSLAGWSILRTTTIGEFVGFSTPDLDAIRLAPETHLPSGEPMARCVSPLDPLDNYQLYQDLKIRGPQNRRPLNVTLSGWWFIPSSGNYAPNNQRMGLVLATLLDDAKLPGDYYQPQDVAFTTLDESSPRDQLFYQECTIELPPGVETTVHVAVCFPQGVTFVGGLDLTVDDGLLYNESPTTIGPGLVMHAQDAAFAKSDVNIDWSANTVGDQQVREYVFNEHTNIGQAIAGLASEGWFDWFVTYSPARRWATFLAPRRGSYRPRARVRAAADGRGNVERVERRRMWQSGSTVVAAQTRSNGNHERAARSDHDLTLEEVVVAQREPRDYDLAREASKRLAPAASASVVEVSTRPGDERFLLGLQVGDTTDVGCTFPGHRVSGRHRVVRREIVPARDAAILTMNPDPT